MKRLFYILVTFSTVLLGCSKQPVEPSVKEYFALWNQCESLIALKGYVEDVTNPSSANFIPEDDRIVTFDMDGTGWRQNAPSWLLSLLMMEAGMRCILISTPYPDITGSESWGGEAVEAVSARTGGDALQQQA